MESCTRSHRCVTQWSVLLNICVVSPHRDDACFSLGLSLVGWANAGHRIRVLNCFTRSAFAPFSDAETVHPNDRTSYVSAMREREDKVFLRRIPGADMMDLRLKDAPLRFRCEVDEVFRRPMSEADPAIAKIRAALEKRVGIDRAEVLFLPCGIGRHVDHITVREAAMPFGRPLACGFYEDLPYASREGAERELETLVEELGGRPGWALTPVVRQDDADAAARKRKLTEIYCSQVDESSVEAMSRYAERYQGERIWANERLADLLRSGVDGWLS